MEETLLHIELLENEQMNFKMKGDPVMICKMVANVMKSRQDIAAVFLIAVIDYLDNKDFSKEQIVKMIDRSINTKRKGAGYGG